MIEHSRTVAPMPKGYWNTSYRLVSDPTVHECRSLHVNPTQKLCIGIQRPFFSTRLIATH